MRFIMTVIACGILRSQRTLVWTSSVFGGDVALPARMQLINLGLSFYTMCTNSLFLSLSKNRKGLIPIGCLIVSA